MFWPFTVWINCSSDLKNFANSWLSASNFKSFSRPLEQFFFTVGQNNFDNKIPLLKYMYNSRWFIYFLSVSSTPMEITWYCLLLRMAYSYSNTFANKCIFSRLQIREPVLKWVRFGSQCRYSSLAELGLRPPSHNKVCIV